MSAHAIVNSGEAAGDVCRTVVRARRRAALTAAVLWALTAASGAWAQELQAPLAYVRALAVEQPRLDLPPDPPVEPAPPVAQRRERARWTARQAERETRAALRANVPEELGEAVLTRLARLPGLVLLEPDTTLAPGMTADASLRMTVNRFGILTGAYRTLWFRVVFRLIRADEPESRRPFYAYGAGSVAQWIKVPGFQKTDRQLLAEAVAQASRQIVAALLTGRDSPFAKSARVAIVPARMPEAIEKEFEGSAKLASIPGDSLSRLADVLLQPELSPLAYPIDGDEVNRAMAALGLTPASFYSPDGALNPGAARSLAARLKADLLFFSWVSDAAVAERDVMVDARGVLKEGKERLGTAEASALLWRASDEKVLWSALGEGKSVSRTQYVRRGPRLDRDESVAADALRAAYASLRASFDDYLRGFERYSEGERRRQ